MISEELKLIVDKFNQKGKMSFLEETTEEKIAEFEKEYSVKLPEEYKEWLLFSDGGELFLPAGIQLYGMGFTVVPFGQGFKDMNPPTKELMKLTLEKKLAHGGHPVLRWMMDNIYIRRDPAGNIKADKEKSTEKIDGAIATIMGLDRAIRCGNQVEESVYNHRGILFI